MKIEIDKYKSGAVNHCQKIGTIVFEVSQDDEFVKISFDADTSVCVDRNDLDKMTRVL